MWRFGLGRNRLELSRFTPLPEDGYLVGEAIRNALLGRTVTTLKWLVASPRQAAEKQAAQLGVKALAADESWQVQADKLYIFEHLGLDVESHLQKSDFTVNAIAADTTGRLIDPFGGRADLAKKRVRSINPDGFVRHPLWCLSAVRLAADLGFDLEPTTEQALKDALKLQFSKNLDWLAIGSELTKLILLDNAAHGFKALASLDMLELYLPELARAKGVTQGGFHHLDVLEHSLEALNQLIQGFPDARLSLRWATLLHDVAKPQTKTYDESGQYHFRGHAKLGAELCENMLRRYGVDEPVVQKASELVHYHMVQLPNSARSAERFAQRRKNILPDLLKLMLADREAARGPMSSEASRQRYRLAMAKVLKALAKVPDKAPLLDGDEVMQLLAVDAGPLVGEALNFLEAAEDAGDISNKHDAETALLRFARAQGWLKSD